MQLGDFELKTISGGNYWIDGGSMFGTFTGSTWIGGTGGASRVTTGSCGVMGLRRGAMGGGSWGFFQVVTTIGGGSPNSDLASSGANFWMAR